MIRLLTKQSSLVTLQSRFTKCENPKNVSVSKRAKTSAFDSSFANRVIPLRKVCIYLIPHSIVFSSAELVHPHPGTFYPGQLANWEWPAVYYLGMFPRFTKTMLSCLLDIGEIYQTKLRFKAILSCHRTQHSLVCNMAAVGTADWAGPLFLTQFTILTTSVSQTAGSIWSPLGTFDDPAASFTVSEPWTTSLSAPCKILVTLSKGRWQPHLSENRNAHKI